LEGKGEGEEGKGKKEDKKGMGRRRKGERMGEREEQLPRVSLDARNAPALISDIAA